jgi:phosphatidylserine/phosphatidylglycerophosphate/cardiolipin synthase-like enzyme
LAKLGEADLRALAAAIRSGRLGPPFDVSSVQRVVGSAMASAAAGAIARLLSKGCTSEALAAAIEMIADAGTLHGAVEGAVQLVMTGPQDSGACHRDTGVVVRDLFRRARRSVLVAGYAVYQGKYVFADLASRMEEMPDLHVRLFLNIAQTDSVAKFQDRFRTMHWPDNGRLPEVYYDRRSLSASPDAPVSLHAKCIVVDGGELFISSANFTEAAQGRNIEAGVLISSVPLARQCEEFFNETVRSGICLRAL